MRQTSMMLTLDASMKTIITHPNFEYIGRQLVENNPNLFQFWEVIFWKFPDGWVNQSIKSVKEMVEHQDITYIWDFSTPESMFEQYALLFNIVKNNAKKITIIMPFFPVWTSERVEKKGETETAHAFAYLISTLPSGSREKNSVHIFDIHALVEQSLFDINRINAELHTLTTTLKINPWECIVFPDEWAAKRFKFVFPEVPTERRIICGKTRGNGEERFITIKEGNPQWKDVIIIDDLIQSGGTIRETAVLLRQKWAQKVRAFAPHWVFPNSSHTVLANAVDELIVTDSIPENIQRAKGVPNMRVESICPLIEKILIW